MSTTETKVGHTPLEWQIVQSGDNAHIRSTSLSDYDGRGYVGCVNRLPDAEFIVRAVNSHADMLEALELAQATLETLNAEGDIAVDKSVFDKTRAAIEKARGIA